MTKLLKKSVAFFPSVASMARNPYWPMLASALEKDGINFQYETPKAFTKSWLLSHQNRVHVLHIHYCQPFYRKRRKASGKKVLIFFLRLLLARLLGYRVVFTLHNLTPTYPLEPHWLDKLGHLVAILLSERVIVHCYEAKRLLTKQYWRRRKVFVVDHPNFSDIYPNQISKEDAQNQLGLENGEQFVFTYLGGIRPNKGIETLIQAFQELKDDKYRLVIAGNNQSPKYAEYLRKIAKKDRRISFHLHWIPDEEIQVFLNAAEIIVLPFERILTSSSTILAMSFKKPVIVPRMGCLQELVEPDAGWLYEAGNSVSLAEVMQVAAESNYKLIGINARKKVSTYTLERFSKQTQEAYWG